MESVPQLISDYLDGELEEAGVNRLADFLRNDPAAVDQLVIDSFVHSQLYQWMNLRHMRDELLADAFGETDSKDCSLESLDEAMAAGSSLNQSIVKGAEAEALRNSRRRWLGLIAGLASMLLIAASIFTASYVIASRPAIVAQLTQNRGCVWAVSSGLPVGALLREGQALTLTSGRALVTFECGAQMVVEGPASVRLISASKAALEHGRVGAKVPTQAIGFTVATPAADFVDLGTEFTLMLEKSRSCELQVFEGLVELRLFKPNSTEIEQRLRISEGSAVRFDAARHDVASIAYDEEQRILP